ncbi:MAG: ureidoglycolate lyase [Thermodesulfobacteriota bacterium]
MIINAKPLTAREFKPFGQVLMGRNKGDERLAYAAKMQNSRVAAKPNMTFMRVAPAEKPILIKCLERHVYSNQTFIPLNGTYHLVAVCPSGADGHPLVDRLAAFIADGSQAVNYNAGTWHAPRTAIREPGEFIMFRWDEENSLDVELVQLDDAVEVNVFGLT